MAVLLIANIKKAIVLDGKDVIMVLPYVLFIVLLIIAIIKGKSFSRSYVFYFLYHILLICAIFVDIKSKTNTLYYLSAAVILLETIISNLQYPFFIIIVASLTEMAGVILIGVYKNTKNSNNNFQLPNSFNTNSNISNTDNDIEKLLKYKDMLDKGLINKTEFMWKE